MDPKQTPGHECHEISLKKFYSNLLKSFYFPRRRYEAYRRRDIQKISLRVIFEVFRRLVLVSGLSRPEYRTRLLSGRPQIVQAALGPARKWPGSFRTAPRAVQSEICSARKGPGQPETNTTFTYLKKDFRKKLFEDLQKKINVKILKIFDQKSSENLFFKRLKKKRCGSWVVF